MTVNRPFTASTNKLAYAQSFSRLTAPGYAEHARGRDHLIGRGHVLRSFARGRTTTGRHRIAAH